MGSDTLVISPVYNERHTLKVFSEKLNESCPWDILFINDGSTDGSERILKKLCRNMIACNVSIISHTSRMGYGAALNSGFSYAINHDYEKVVTLDADLQHRPEDISRFVDALDRYEVVLGTRYRKINYPLSTPIIRYIINRYISGLLRRYFQVDFSDPFCGFRGYRTSFLTNVRLNEQSYGSCLEILVELVQHEACFCELPVDLIYIDRSRTFHDGLNDPSKRYDYYKNILKNKLMEFEKEQKEKSTVHSY
ncbi:MAG: glycosyltransferase family 2 protein [Spirochaetota bacterium]|nr:MAG: glycosyltransferase family 2 protein [Spirochaetota bacterium]